MDNRELAVPPQRHILDVMPHKQSFDRERCNSFTKNSGHFSHHVDTKYGINLDAFQSLDMRTMRQLVKQRVWNHSNKLKHIYLNNAGVQNKNEMTSNGFVIDNNKV